MAKFQKPAVTVDAYKIQTVGAADNDGNVQVSCTDGGLAGTIPYSFTSDQIEPFKPGDYVVEDQAGEVSLMSNADFIATYHEVQ